MSIVWIAIATVREAARGRAVRALAALAVVLLFLIALLPAVAPEEKAVMLVKLLVGVAGIVATVSLTFVGAAAVSGDLERGHLAVVFAKPVSRAGWIAGRALGVAALAPILLGALYGIALAAFYLATSGDLSSELRLLHPEREIVGHVGKLADGPAVEWTFDETALASRPHVLRLRPRAEDERMPRVPAVLCVSRGVDEPAETRNFSVGRDLVRDLELPPGLLDGKGLRVRVIPRDEAAALRADPDAAVLLAPSTGGFASNLARAFASLAAAASLAGAFSVAASAAVGGRIALLLALTLVVAGSLVESMRAFGRLAEDGAPVLAAFDGSAPVTSPGPFRVVLGRAVGCLAYAMPDLGRFDLSRALVGGREIPWTTLGENAAYALAYAAASCALGCFAFRGREVAR
ncbi:MAG: ABC transporter permease [Planctomycetes bacterium]|nr:ABC transporter permease [Planctomycetota bacterium]MBI3844242.1 ABC transporter permease [Planctomycetota bacterium]